MSEKPCRDLGLMADDPDLLLSAATYLLQRTNLLIPS